MNIASLSLSLLFSGYCVIAIILAGFKYITSGGDSAGVPGWTWGLIGGLLLVAVIVSAGILRRGDDGDEGKDWDY